MHNKLKFTCNEEVELSYAMNVQNVRSRFSVQNDDISLLQVVFDEISFLKVWENCSITLLQFFSVNFKMHLIILKMC